MQKSGRLERCDSLLGLKKRIGIDQKMQMYKPHT